MRIAALALVLSVLANVATATGETSPPLPPPPLDSAPAVPFENATFNFNNTYFPAAVKIVVQMEPYDRTKKTRVHAMDVSLGGDTIHVGPEMLADIPGPNLLRLEATAFTDFSGEKIVAVLLMQMDDCPPKGCGLVELEWTVNKGIRKLDYRTSANSR